MKIFIGSSSKEELEVRRIKDKIVEFNKEYEPIPWFDSFPACEYTMESLVKIANNTVECAIFIFAEDDKVSNERGESYKARDNVLFEYGLFAGALGVKNVLAVCKDNVNMPSDLMGVTHISIDRNFDSNLKKWLLNITEQEVAIDTDNLEGSILKKDNEGYYYASIINKRYRPSKKNNKEYGIYKMDGVIKEYLEDDETYWLLYEKDRFADLNIGDKVKFKIDSVDKVKEYNGEKSKNVYVSDVVKI